MRERWDESHGQQTYGAMTIAKALAAVTGQYQPRKSSKNGAPKSSATPAAPLPSSGRPQIQGNERQLRDIRGDALGALYAANRPPRLFQRAGGITRIGFVQQEPDGGAVPRVQQFDADALRGELTNVADWFTLKHGKQSDFLTPDLPPLAIARDILAQRLNRLNWEINNRAVWDEDVARRSPHAAKQPLTDAEIEARRTELQNLARSSLAWRAFTYFMGCFACQAFWTAAAAYIVTRGVGDVCGWFAAVWRSGYRAR